MNGYEEKEHKQIINTLTLLTLLIIGMIILYHEKIGNFYIWTAAITIFIITNITLLYRSLDYIEKYDDSAIGIIGVVVSGTLLLIILAIIIMFIISMYNKVKEGG